MSTPVILARVKEVIPIIFAVCSMLWLAYFAVEPFDGKTSDFPQYYAPTRLIVTGHGADAYNFEKVTELEHKSFPSMGERLQPVYLPPPSQALMLPLGFFSSDVAPVVWRVLQIASLTTSIFLLKSSFALNRKALFWLIAVLCAAGPVFMAIKIEQLSLILLCALSFVIWGFKKDNSWVTAIALSFLMLKPQEGLPVLIYLLGAGRYKPVMMTLAVMAVCTVAITGLIGVPSVQEYLAFATNFVDKDAFLQAELGPNLRGQLLRLAPDSKSSIATFSAVTSFIAYIFIFFSGRKFATRPAWLEAGLMIAVPLGLVTIFYVQSYDMVLLAPAVLILMAGPLERAIPPVLMLLAFLILGPFMIPFYILIHHNYLLEGHGVFNPLFFSLLSFAVMMVWIAYRYPDKIVPEGASK